MHNWLLPEHIADILPATARQLESAKAAMLERFRRYGYELVSPPLIEYTDSLLTNADPALDMQTFKLDDQLSGRQLGLRADMTPQVARIDAHLLAHRQGVTRLCYAGSVVHTRASGLMRSREPLQVGAELYGCYDLAADIEIIELMLSTWPAWVLMPSRSTWGTWGYTARWCAKPSWMVKPSRHCLLPCRPRIALRSKR